MAELLVSFTDERDIASLSYVKRRLLQYLVERGATTLEDVKRGIVEFLVGEGHVLPSIDAEQALLANVEAFNEWVNELYSDARLVQRHELELSTLNLIAMSYLSLVKWPELRGEYLLDAVACEYLLHVALKLRDPTLVQRAHEAARAIRARISQRLVQMESR